MKFAATFAAMRRRLTSWHLQIPPTSVNEQKQPPYAYMHVCFYKKEQ